MTGTWSPIRESDRTKIAGIGSGGLFSLPVVFVIASRSIGSKRSFRSMILPDASHDRVHS